MNAAITGIKKKINIANKAGAIKKYAAVDVNEYECFIAFIFFFPLLARLAFGCLLLTFY